MYLTCNAPSPPSKSTTEMLWTCFYKIIKNLLPVFPKRDIMKHIIVYLFKEKTLMEYIKASKAAEKWGISPRRVRVLCAEGKIEGMLFGKNLRKVYEQ